MYIYIYIYIYRALLAYFTLNHPSKRKLHKLSRCHTTGHSRDENKIINIFAIIIIKQFSFD